MHWKLVQQQLQAPYQTIKVIKQRFWLDGQNYLALFYGESMGAVQMLHHITPAGLENPRRKERKVLNNTSSQRLQLVCRKVK